MLGCVSVTRLSFVWPYSISSIRLLSSLKLTDTKKVFWQKLEISGFHSRLSRVLLHVETLDKELYCVVTFQFFSFSSQFVPVFFFHPPPSAWAAFASRRTDKGRRKGIAWKQNLLLAARSALLHPRRSHKMALAKCPTKRMASLSRLPSAA